MIPIGIIGMLSLICGQNIPDRDYGMGRHTFKTSHELGALIRAERKSLGLTQADLAAASGVSLRFIGELERGRPSVGLERVLRVLQLLGLQAWVEGPGDSENA